MSLGLEFHSQNKTTKISSIPQNSEKKQDINKYEGFVVVKYIPKLASKTKIN
jgi:hypothetical protein